MPEREREALDFGLESTNRMNAIMNVTDVGVDDRREAAPVAGGDRVNGERPARASSLTRSKITMLASAATPIVRIRPAIPGSVSVTGISLISAKK